MKNTVAYNINLSDRLNGMEYLYFESAIKKLVTVIVTSFMVQMTGLEPARRGH